MKNEKPKIAILYSHYPHYRSGVFNHLSKSQKYVYYFYFSELDFGVRCGNSSFEAVYLPIIKLGKLYAQLGFIKEMIKYRFDAIIILSNPYIVSNWIYAILARMTGVKLLFWTHGWIRYDPWWKAFIRDIYHKIPNVILLYGERARSIGLKKGFPEKNMHVIYNSLDYETQKYFFEIQQKNKNPENQGNIYFIYIGRIVEKVKLELAVNALALVRAKTGISYPFFLIGDGPCKDSIIALAKRKNVSLVLKGEVYEECEIAPLIYNARALIAPGKVGLTAMHSLAYGTPVITHGNMDFQMPEVEAIIPNLTGDFFEMDSETDLASKICKWAKKKRDLSERFAAINTIENKYNPIRQKKEIEYVIDQLLKKALNNSRHS